MNEPDINEDERSSNRSRLKLRYLPIDPPDARDAKFPGWCAPFLGAVVGGAIGISMLARGETALGWPAVAGAALMGFAAGTLIFLYDFFRASQW